MKIWEWKYEVPHTRNWQYIVCIPKLSGGFVDPRFQVVSVLNIHGRELLLALSQGKAEGERYM